MSSDYRKRIRLEQWLRRLKGYERTSGDMAISRTAIGGQKLSMSAAALMVVCGFCLLSTTLSLSLPVFSRTALTGITTTTSPFLWEEPDRSGSRFGLDQTKQELVKISLRGMAMSAAPPNMFLPTSRLSSVMPTATANTLSRRETRYVGEDKSQLFCPQRERGILGFRLEDSEDESQHRRSSTSSSALFSSRPTNVDSNVWNLPDSAYPQRRRILTLSPNSFNTVLSWFPWIPTRTQIEALKVEELRQVCTERGLSLEGRKAELRDRLSSWATEQQELLRQRSKLFQTSTFGDIASWSVDAAIKERVEPQRLATKETRDTSVTGAYDDAVAHLEANSLAEWARTVDLQPLLQRRMVIQREKTNGKSVPTRVKTRKEPTLSDLTKAFLREPKSNNLQVKELYAAAKEADQRGDRDLAKELLLRLKETTPHDGRIYRRLSRMEMEEGNQSGARAMLQEGLRLDPNNAYLWHGLAQLASTDAEAKTFWKRAIQVDPAFPNPYHALGTLEHLQGNIALAMKTLKKGLEFCPKNHRLHHALGDLYRDAKMLDMAERSYMKALKLSPPVSQGFAYTALAFVAYEQGQVDQSRSWLRKAAALNEGRQANAWLSLAQMEEAEGNIDAARTVYMTGLSKYERGLLERNRKVKLPKNTRELNLTEDPIVLKNRMLKSVPVYRSGDRFFNVYRSWARLEERYGSLESTEGVYNRAIAAFPFEWKLTLDMAQYYGSLRRTDLARTAYGKACAQAGHRHATPHRLFAEFEIESGNYKAARAILFRGATALTQSLDGPVGGDSGLAELFHTWGICEWHLGELAQAEVLFDYALRMTHVGLEGAKVRSYILYSMARLHFAQEEYFLAQHCIGLCLKEDVIPGGNSRVWALWGDVASAMGNTVLADDCNAQANKLKHDETGAAGISRLLDIAKPGLARLKGKDMEDLMRRDPWHYEIFGWSKPDNRFHRLKYPESEKR